MTASLPVDTAAKFTEAQMLGLLRKKLTSAGNGGNGEYAVLGGVRNGAGFESNRTFDAVSISLWPSRGLSIHVYEIKVSRSDWQRELAKPDKAEDACKVADHFSIVVPAGIVRDGELPPTWGLLETVGKGDKIRLQTKTAAPRLHDDWTKKTPVDRGFLVAMLRSCPGAIPGQRLPAVQQEQLDEAYKRGYEKAKDEKVSHSRMKLERLEILEHDAAVLTKALTDAGVDRHTTSPHALIRYAPAIADAIHGAKVDGRLEQARVALRNALEALG